MPTEVAVREYARERLICPFGCDRTSLPLLSQILDSSHVPVADLIGCPTCFNPIEVTWSDGRPVAKRLDGVPPLAELAVPGSVIANALSRLPGYVENMPSPPELARRIISLIHDPLGSASEIGRVVETDPGFSVQVLRLANSALVRGATEIRDISAACTRIGLKALLNVAYSICYRRAYAGAGKQLSNVTPTLWRRSLSTAHLSSQIASRVKGMDPGRLFLAGLSRDIGRLVMLDLLTAQPREARHLLSSREKIGIILRRFGPYAGLQVTQRWNLAPSVRQFVFFAETPSTIPDKSLRRDAMLLLLCAQIVERLGDSPAAVDLDTEVLSPALADERVDGLNIEKSQLMECVESFIGELDTILAGFRLD